MALEKCFECLRDAQAPLSAVLLAQLSCLEGEDLEEFKGAWADTAPERRLRAIGVLLELAEDNVELDFAAVCRHALEDEDDEVRAAAIAALWECEERSLIVPLVRMVHQDESEKVRAAAAEGLGRFALLAEVGKLLKRDQQRIAEALLHVVEDEEETWTVRRRAIEAVAPMTLPQVDRIIEEAYGSDDQEVRISALHAMGRTCKARWLPTLLAALDHEDPALRYEAAAALGELGEKEAVTYLIALINDPDAQAREAAVQALGAIGGAVARKALERTTEMSDAGLAELARDALESVALGEGPLDGLTGST